MSTSNDLRYSTTKTVGNENITVNIRLNDECKNGHQDFSITGDIYKAGKPRTDKYWLGGGCIHEDILKHFPEFAIFVRLHLCDYEGIPMHCTANGFFHLKEGFNSKSTGEAFKAEYCDYYRITPAQFDVLKTARNQTQFAVSLVKLGVLDQWKNEAKAAIIMLQDLTGKTFEVGSTRSQYIAPTPEELEQEAERQRSGYYTPEAEQKREEAKREGLLNALAADRDKIIIRATLEYETKKEVLLKGGEKSLKNCIFYTHTNEVHFNWRGYDKLPEDEIKNLISILQLPEGVTAKISVNK